MLEAGDTLYLPKGVVHYAEGAGELSVHATIGIRREGSTWFDLVYHEIVKKYQQSKSTDTILHPDLIENMVQSTQLGLRLAQLVPVGEVDRLYKRSSSSPLELDRDELQHPLEELLLFYMDELVDAVLFHATSLSIMPQPNPKIYGRGHLHESVLQHLIDTHFCPDVDPEFDEDPTVAFELPITDRIESLQVSNSPKNFLSLARESRPQRAACHDRDTFGNHDDADHNDHRHRDARASSSDFNFAMMSNGRGTNVRAKRKDTADENPCDGTEFAANSGYRQKRGYTNHGVYHCDGGCDSSCNVFGENCDSSCESDCECNAGYAYPHQQTQSAAAAGCEANPCNGRNTYQSKGDRYPCQDRRNGPCNSGKYWKGASITASGTCTQVPQGKFTTEANFNQLEADIQIWRVPCASGTEYESQAPQGYRDRICTAVSDCSPGSYISKAATSNSDRVCTQCSKGEYSITINAASCMTTTTTRTTTTTATTRTYTGTTTTTTTTITRTTYTGTTYTGITTTTTTTTYTATTTTITTTHLPSVCHGIAEHPECGQGDLLTKTRCKPAPPLSKDAATAASVFHNDTISAFVRSVCPIMCGECSESTTTTTTATTTTYANNGVDCHGQPEEPECGSPMLPKESCDRDDVIGTFARSACPLMCSVCPKTTQAVAVVATTPVSDQAGSASTAGSMMDSKLTAYVIIGALIGGMLLVIIVRLFCCGPGSSSSKSQLSKPVGQRSFDAMFEEMKVLGAISQDAMQAKPREINRKAVNLIEKYGAGSYGEVWKGMLDEAGADGGTLAHGRAMIPAYLVAVKTTVPKAKATPFKRTGFARAFTQRHANGGADFAGDADEHLGIDELKAEALVMAHVGAHTNLVSLIGVVTSGVPYLLVISFCEHGSLDKLLQMFGTGDVPNFSRNNSQTSAAGGGGGSQNTLSVTPMRVRAATADKQLANLFSDAGRLNIMLQTAKGMAHLTKNFVHRDLAARNVLVDSAFVCRVADFGLSRLAEKAAAEGEGEDGEEDQIYESTTGTFPVRSTAPEAMTEAKFTQASDVWSWGILGIEVYTNGARLFDEWSNMQLPGKICTGLRPKQPPLCADPVFKMLARCWNQTAADRPDFDALVAYCRRLANRPNSVVSLMHSPPVAQRPVSSISFASGSSSSNAPPIPAHTPYDGASAGAGADGVHETALDDNMYTDLGVSQPDVVAPRLHSLRNKPSSAGTGASVNPRLSSQIHDGDGNGKDDIDGDHDDGIYGGWVQETVRKASSEHIFQESVDVGGSGSGGGKPVAARALTASNVSETDYGDLYVAPNSDGMYVAPNGSAATVVQPLKKSAIAPPTTNEEDFVYEEPESLRTSFTKPAKRPSLTIKGLDGVMESTDSDTLATNVYYEEPSTADERGNQDGQDGQDKDGATPPARPPKTVATVGTASTAGGGDESHRSAASVRRVKTRAATLSIETVVEGTFTVVFQGGKKSGTKMWVVGSSSSDATRSKIEVFDKARTGGKGRSMPKLTIRVKNINSAIMTKVKRKNGLLVVDAQSRGSRAARKTTFFASAAAADHGDDLLAKLHLFASNAGGEVKADPAEPKAKNGPDPRAESAVAPTSGPALNAAIAPRVQRDGQGLSSSSAARDAALRQGGYNPDEGGDEIYEPMSRGNSQRGSAASIGIGGFPIHTDVLGHHTPYSVDGARGGGNSSGEDNYELVEATPRPLPVSGHHAATEQQSGEYMSVADIANGTGSSDDGANDIYGNDSSGNLSLNEDPAIGIAL